mgnify:CR=1 FL=1|nr:MAG TPA: protein of unknown function DUF285 [Caudoviricetes sp.]
MSKIIGSPICLHTTKQISSNPISFLSSSWYKSTVDKSTITKILLKSKYTLTGTEDESWDASEAQDKSVMAYRIGTEIIIANNNNGVGKIYANANSKSAFKGFSGMTNFINANILDTSYVEDMTGMFENCSALTNLYVSNWNTSKVTSIWGMFNNCSALIYVGNLSNWDTSQVTDMRIVFQNCKVLESVGNISGWNTAKVTSMGWMFNNCFKLNGLGDLSQWNTSNVTHMGWMFYACNALSSVGDLSGWDTAKVTNMKSMFCNCTVLTKLDLSGWNVSQVTDILFMFSGCNALTSVGDLSGWNPLKATSLQSMFYNCFKLNGLGDLSGWDTSKVTSMYGTFYDCRALTDLNVSGWDTSNVTDMRFTFNRCASLSVLDLSGWNTSKVTNMQAKYYGCNKLEKLVLGANYKFVGTNSYLPMPLSRYIPGANNWWYIDGTTTRYTPDNLIKIVRTNTTTYTAVPVTRPNYMPIKGDILNIDLDGNGNQKYRVLSINGNVAKLLAMYDVALDKYYDADYTKGSILTLANGTNFRGYAGSDLDTYLNITWYNTLSKSSKAAIVPENIYQYVYEPLDDDASSYTYKCYHTFADSLDSCMNQIGYTVVGNRNVFALDVKDIFDYWESNYITGETISTLCLDRSQKVYGNFFLRSARKQYTRSVWGVSLRGGYVYETSVDDEHAIRPAFNIDLSKISFSKS